jgi:hypothetical protein
VCDSRNALGVKRLKGNDCIIAIEELGTKETQRFRLIVDNRLFAEAKGRLLFAAEIRRPPPRRRRRAARPATVSGRALVRRL